MEPTIIPTINNLVNTGQVVNNSGFFGFVAIFILLGFVVFVLSIAALVLWIWSIVNVAKNNNFKDDNTRIMWLLLIVLLGPIVSLVYLFARPKNK